MQWEFIAVQEKTEEKKTPLHSTSDDICGI